METTWTELELREWRGRLRWTQARAAEALCYHLAAYKRLELGTRPVCARTRKLCLLLEREHARAMFNVANPGPGGEREVWATAERALARMEALASERPARATQPLRHLALFAGLGGATAALERIGAEVITVGFADIDPAANATLRYRWPDVPRLGDVTTVDWSRLRGHVDLVTGGSPCQSFSVAGKRLGLADPRGNLALHFLRAVDAVRPRWFLYENVPGLMAANDGEDFGIFLDAVEECGYACAWRVLDARHFGLPQRRRRLWLLGERAGSGSGPAEVLAVRESQEGDSGSRGTKWQTAPRRARTRAEGIAQAPDWSDAASWSSGVDPVPVATPSSCTAEPVGEVIAFQPVAGARARGMGLDVGQAPTLNSASGGNRTGAVLYAADIRHGTLAEVAPTIQVGPAHGWSAHATPFALHSTDMPGQIVLRRFTPLECLRLQGFDDDWLDGPRFGGKPLTDGDRYRLVGNAWPVSVAAWVLERLLSVSATPTR